MKATAKVGSTWSRWAAAAAGAAFAACAGIASAQWSFVKVGAETIYDAGTRCAVPFWDFGDFNGDGRLDFVLSGTSSTVFSASSSPAPLMMWIAQPDGSFQERAAQLFSGPVTSAYLFSQVRVADFNGDGIPDIFIPDAGIDTYANGVPVGPWLGATPRLALSTPTGYVDASAMFAGLTPTFSHTAVVADIERNGSPDIYVGSISAGSQSKLPYLLVNNGSASFTYSQSRLPPIVASESRYGMRTRPIDAVTRYVTPESYTGALFADVDQDGYPDLIVLPSDATPTGLLFLNDGTGDFSKRPRIELPAGRYGEGWLIEKKNPDGSIAYPLLPGPGTATIELDAKAVDLNGDGYPDLVILETQHQEAPEYIYYRGGRIQILINQGGTGFVDETDARGAPGFDAPANYDSYHATLVVRDINGDGHPDIVAIHTTGNYAPDVFLNDGSGKFARATLPGIPSDGLYVVLSGGLQQPTRIANVRFANRVLNGVGYCTLGVQTYERPAPGGLFFQHTDGRTYRWLVNAGTLLASTPLTALGSGFRVKGVGSFDGQRPDDFLMRDGTGSNRIVRLGPSDAAIRNVVAQHDIVPAGLNWDVAGVGDFDGDGKADILWRDVGGANFMFSQFNPATGAVVQNAVPGLGIDWKVAGIADFDGDGKADIFWRNINGANAIWLMNGPQVKQVLNVAGLGTDWSIAGIADFDRDGKPDLLWRNIGGYNGIWFMNVNAMQRIANVAGVTPDWRVVGVADYNGDAFPDILWEQTVNGTRVVWMLNAGAYQSEAVLPGTGDIGWQVVNPTSSR